MLKTLHRLFSRLYFVVFFVFIALLIWQELGGKPVLVGLARQMYLVLMLQIGLIAIFLAVWIGKRNGWPNRQPGVTAKLAQFLSRWPRTKQLQKSGIERPPLARTRALLRFICTEKIFQQVFEPTINDCIEEYLQCLSARRLRRANYIKILYVLIIIRTSVVLILTKTVAKFVKDLFPAKSDG